MAKLLFVFGRKLTFLVRDILLDTRKFSGARGLTGDFDGVGLTAQAARYVKNAHVYAPWFGYEYTETWASRLDLFYGVGSDISGSSDGTSP